VRFENLRKKCGLGRGGFCKVTLVEDVSDGKRYALKTMSKGYLSQSGAERQIRWERELLSIVDSPFIINLHKTFIDSQHIFFLLEAALGGSLADVLADNPEVFLEDRPRGSAAAFYVGCLVLALEHLHTRSIAHRDVKTENVLLDERGYAKLCDMGFARYVLGKTSTLAGTPEYMAPEMIDFPHTHDQSVDWWALGVLTFELLSGQTPFEDEGITDPHGRLLAIRRSQESGKLAFPFNFPHVSKAFVNAVLRKLPKRLGAGEGGADKLKAHPMFRAVKFDWAEFEARHMPAPFSKEWDETAVEEDDDVDLPVDLYGCMDDRGSDRDRDNGSLELGFDQGDSLYVTCQTEVEDGSIDWGRLLS
jgi:serine/threonine protein kinase